ncbi:helix-turn-helix domain-containing protein [Microbispora sp. H11081]|uniref:helix-turn-helix domain-containing protein n=1 Tax=Microbispora sp. H11081 TaxID=2729107 RepID=UPI0014726CBD|nr:helix-turn-helix transcriptional regulator [Microbispora sp. H11081]
MDPHIADLLGIDLDDPAERREADAIERDMDLIETLVQIRKEQGLTQADVAERMGRSQPAVSDFERLGGDPHLSTIRRYALAIGAEVHHVVTGVHSWSREMTRSVDPLLVVVHPSVGLRSPTQPSTAVGGLCAHLETA